MGSNANCSPNSKKKISQKKLRLKTKSIGDINVIIVQQGKFPQLYICLQIIISEQRCKKEKFKRERFLRLRHSLLMHNKNNFEIIAIMKRGN